MIPNVMKKAPKNHVRFIFSPNITNANTPVNITLIDEEMITTIRVPFFSKAIKKLDNIKPLNSNIIIKQRNRIIYEKPVQYDSDNPLMFDKSVEYKINVDVFPESANFPNKPPIAPNTPQK